MLGKPIPTEYAGHRFRSRIEARWAMVLDELGIRWDYEREGYTFELESGEKVSYLPDFYLPDQNAWLEIKPEAKNLSAEVGAEASWKAWSLEQTTGGTVFIAFGFKDAFIGHFNVTEEVTMDQGYFERCGECRKWMLVLETQTIFPCGHTTAYGWSGVFLDDVFRDAAAHRFWDPK